MEQRASWWGEKRREAARLDPEDQQLGSAEQRRDTSFYQGRYKWLILFLALLFTVLLGRLWHLQILQGERFYRLSTENIIRTNDIKPPRGRIYDQSGIVLADNRPSYDVYVLPRELRWRKLKQEERQRYLQELERLLSLSPRDIVRLEKQLDQGIAQVMVRRDVTRQQVAMLEARRIDLPGLDVRANPHRVYPMHQVGAHTVGFLGEINDKELAASEGVGYRTGDYIGRMGLERAFEDILRGSPGLERIVVDSAGNPQGEAETRFLIGEYQHVRPVAGRDLVLTLDAELMLIIDHAMRKYPSGAVVAVDPRDGRVLALYSKPSFNPNSWTGRLSAQEKLRSDSDPYKPMIDKSVSAYFPGSVYKIVSSLAALEEGVFKIEDEVDCPGYYKYGGRRFRCWKHSGHEKTNIIKALAASCDVYYYKVAEALGIDKLADYSYRFGFGEPTGLPINREAAGRVPTREWHRKNSPDGYQHGFALNTAIGQGDTLTTPLQIAMAYAAIANGGTLYKPLLIKEIRTREGVPLFTYSPQVRKQLNLKPEHLAAIRQGLKEVVTAEYGTVHSTKAPMLALKVAGKTGTAQVHAIGRSRVSNKDKNFHLRDHAWFAAYAPYDNPELVLVVFLHHGGHGGPEAGPVAFEIFDRYVHRDASRPLTERLADLSVARLTRADEPQADPRSPTDEDVDSPSEPLDDATGLPSPLLPPTPLAPSEEVP
jgi:penicillin-binding protein 2